MGKLDEEMIETNQTIRKRLAKIEGAERDPDFLDMALVENIADMVEMYRVGVKVLHEHEREDTD